jgi:hypothetical protein
MILGVRGGIHQRPGSKHATKSEIRNSGVEEMFEDREDCVIDRSTGLGGFRCSEVEFPSTRTKFESLYERLSSSSSSESDVVHPEDGDSL